MNIPSFWRLRVITAIVVALATTRYCRAVFGVGDTSFVTVIANPAEAANWAEQIRALANQLAQLQQTENQIELIRQRAGDPSAAASLGSDLSSISAQADALVRGPSTVATLAQSHLGDPAASLEAVGAGATMTVLGQSKPRALAAYAAGAQEMANLSGLRDQIAAEQAARQDTQTALDAAWQQFRVAGTESEKQAAQTRIEQLNATGALIAERRAALLADESLEARQRTAAASIKAMADDEQWLAQGAAVSSLERGRAQAAEAQRLATINASVPASPAGDYSSLHLWMPSDAESQVQ